MTPAQQKAREQAEVMLAFAEGKEIEILDSGSWRTVSRPCWDWYKCTYRIKPKAPKKIKLLALLCQGELRYFQSVDEELEPSWTRIPTLDIETEVSE